MSPEAAVSAVTWGVSVVIAADTPKDVRPRSLIAKPHRVPPKLAHRLRHTQATEN